MANPAPPAQPQASSTDDGLTLRKFAGLKNTVPAERLGPDELERAINVDLNDVGQVSSRRGYTKVNDTPNCSGLFTTDDGDVLAIANGSLVQVLPDYSFAVLQGGFPVPCPPMAWTQVGPIVYFSCSAISGKLDRRTLQVTPWEGPDVSPAFAPPGPAIPKRGIWYSPVVNPTSTIGAVGGRLLGPPPLATTLAYFNGRIYMGQGRHVWATELYNYDYVDKTRNFWTFEADVTMIGAVSDGLYVGTDEGVWFISGETFAKMGRRRVMDFGAIRGSMVYVPAELANPPQVSLDAATEVKVSILFLTHEGYCGGQDGGTCYNYTEAKFIFPNVEGAAALFRRQEGVNQYLAVTNSGGTPSANARIGDWVDAQILRKGNWQTSCEKVRFGDSVSAVVNPG